MYKNKVECLTMCHRKRIRCCDAGNESPITRHAIFIEGPQGSGKSTIASELSRRFGIVVRRGFPTADALQAASDQVQICNLSCNMIGTGSGELVAVYDRSPISNATYMARITGNPRYLSCGLKQIRDLTTSSLVSIVILHTPPEVSHQRQGASILSIDLDEARAESRVYGDLQTLLIRSKIGGLTVLGVNNHNGRSPEEVAHGIINNLNI